MILVIPYSHTDLYQAFRLMKWLGWLSALDHSSMRKERVLLVPSRHASERRIHGQICALAAKIFGEARSFTPAEQYEQGWPGACNFMMKEALEHVEQNFQDDIFLLEPDAIPLSPDWYQRFKDEWESARAAGKEFLGAYVSYDIPHMTGIGIYGRDWRKVSPKLADVQNVRGWDTYASEQILTAAHLTDLIQHKWWRSSSKPYSSLSLADVDPNALIFHQDKEGRLFGLLDQEFWQGRADQAVHYSEQTQQETVTMHYFYTHNLNRPVKSQGHLFHFNAVDEVAGTWRGVYVTEKESEVVALKAAVVESRGGVVELTKEQYEAKTKKKAPVSAPLIVSVNPPASSPTAARINQSPALLVENPELKAPVDENKGTVVKSIEEVLTIAKVKPPETSAKPLGKAKGKQGNKPK